MPLPAGVETVTVSSGEPLSLPDGTPLKGYITFTGPDLVTIGEDDVILGGTVYANLVDGEFTVALVATDATGMSPTGWTYKVEGKFSNAPSWTRYISLPKATPTVKLADIVVPDPVEGAQGTALVINTTGGATGYPLGLPDARETGLSILSSFAGGEDEGQVGQFDSTGRINLYSFQRADVGSYGENLRRFLMRFNAKSMDAWYAARQNGAMTHGYDASNNADADADWVPVAWTGAHLGSNDGLSMHGHWSVEVPDSTGAVQTRIEVPFTDQELPEASRLLGVDVTNIRTNNADLSVRANLGAYGTGYLRIGGGNSVPKELLLSISSDRATSGRRWGVRANTDTESGTNLGTNFEVVRYDDSGNSLGAGLFISRKTGQAAFGGSTVTGGSVRVSWATSGQHGYYATPTSSPGSAAAFAALMTAATDRALDIRVTGDTNARIIIGADGSIEMGDGSVRDVKLYRPSANVLKTDDKLITAVGLGVGNSAAATTLGSVTRKIEVFDASGASLGFIPVYNAIT